MASPAQLSFGALLGVEGEAPVAPRPRAATSRRVPVVVARAAQVALALVEKTKPRTFGDLSRLSREERKFKAELDAERWAPERPKTLADCKRDGWFAGPCPWFGCRHHVGLNVSEQGAVKITFPELELESIRYTCTLRAAEEEGMSPERAAREMGMSLSSFEHEEIRAMRKLKETLSREDFARWITDRKR